MFDTVPTTTDDPSTVPPGGSPGAEPVLRPEARVVRADRSLAAMVLVICTLGGMGVGFGFAMYLMRAQLTYLSACGGRASVVMPAQREGAITWLGVATRTLSDRPGSLIVRVYGDTAAEAAGLHPGDVVTSLDLVHIRDADDLVNAVTRRFPGDLVPIVVERAGQPLVLRARLGAR